MLIPYLYHVITSYSIHYTKLYDNQIDITKEDLTLLVNEIRKENKLIRLIEDDFIKQGHTEAIDLIKPVYFEDVDALTKNFTSRDSRSVYEYLKSLDSFYTNLFALASKKRQNMINYFLENQPERYQERFDSYYNEAISDILKKVYEKQKILEYRNQLVP